MFLKSKKTSDTSKKSSDLPFSEDFFKQVRLLEINTRRIVNSLFAGEYQTAFKGQGMTFAEFREYVPGDDVRHISWNLTAKTGKPYTKMYDEERELTMILVIDVSGSSDYGAGSHLKKEIVTQLSALLAFTAIKNKDRVGLLLFSDQVEHFVPPKKTRKSIYQILYDILYFKPQNKGTKLTECFEHLMTVLKKKSSLFIFSDFLDQGFERSLRQLAQKHDVVALKITDPTEITLPQLGLVHLQDPETNQVITIDTSDPIVRRNYHKEVSNFKNKQSKNLKKANIDVVEIMSDKDFVAPLVAYFKKRYRR